MDKFDLTSLEKGVLAGNRLSTARAITLLESAKVEHKHLSKKLLGRISKTRNDTIRVGISGAPGVGKSTFIEAMGLELIKRSHKIAVLAIDPSSPIVGGSILGDKTRMTELSAHENVFIRPSPSGGNLGGVAKKTREVISILEASGYDIIIVETVGVGQSEVTCANMVDIFMMLQLPNAGDELQGIKKGILELADIVCINKSDGDQVIAAQKTQLQLKNALSLIQYKKSPTIINISSLERTGITDAVGTLLRLVESMKESGDFLRKRNDQSVAWLKKSLELILDDALYHNEKISSLFDYLKKKVKQGEITHENAVEQLSKLIYQDV